MIADLIVLDDRSMRDDPFLAPDIDPHDLVLYRGSARSVSSVVVDGRVVVREGVFLPISEEVVRSNVRRHCDAWRRDVGEGCSSPRCHSPTSWSRTCSITTRNGSCATCSAV